MSAGVTGQQIRPNERRQTALRSRPACLAWYRRVLGDNRRSRPRVGNTLRYRTSEAGGARLARHGFIRLAAGAILS